MKRIVIRNDGDFPGFAPGTAPRVEVETYDPNEVLEPGECPHEFGALGAVSGDWCIHCGAKLSDLKRE
jgi:hypothetical protein